MTSKSTKDVQMIEEVGKLLTKGTAEFKMFMKFWKYNATKGSKKMLAVDQWVLWSKEQVDSITGTKPKLVKAKIFQDEKGFIELAKEHKKFSDVGGVRHYHRFVDFTQSDLAKKIKTKDKTDYMSEFLNNKPESDTEGKNEKSSDSKLTEKEAGSNENSKNEVSSNTEKDSNKKIQPFSRSAKVFDDEVYTIIGSLETAKINYVKGEIGSLKEQMFTTEKQLEGVHNVMFLALSKLGLIDPDSKSPFQKEIKELWYSDEAMQNLRKKTIQNIHVNKIIDELKGKETKQAASEMSWDEDGDKNDYELFENDEKSYNDPIGKKIRQKERVSKHKQDAC